MLGKGGLPARGLGTRNLLRCLCSHTALPSAPRLRPLVQFLLGTPGSWGTAMSEVPTPAPQDVWHRQIQLLACVCGPRQGPRTQHRVPSPWSQSMCRRGCLGGEDTGPNRPSPRPSSHHTRCHFIFPNEVTNCKSLKIPTQPIVMKSQKQARPCLKVIAANLQQRWTEKDTIKAKKAFDRQILLQIFGLIQPVCKHLVYYQYFQTLPLQGLLKICFLLKMINLRVTCSPKSPRSWGLGDEQLVEIYLSYKH